MATAFTTAQSVASIAAKWDIAVDAPGVSEKRHSLSPALADRNDLNSWVRYDEEDARAHANARAKACLPNIIRPTLCPNKMLQSARLRAFCTQQPGSHDI